MKCSRLRPLPAGRVEDYLKERGADETTAHLLAHISGGRPGYALRLMQDSETLAFRAQRLEDLHKLLGSTRRGRFAYAEKLTDRKFEAKERLRETLLVWLSFGGMYCCVYPERIFRSPTWTRLHR